MRTDQKNTPRDDSEERRCGIATVLPEKHREKHVFFGCKPSFPDDSLRYLPVPGVVPSSSAGASTTWHPLFHPTGLNYNNLCVI